MAHAEEWRAVDIPEAANPSALKSALSEWEREAERVREAARHVEEESRRHDTDAIFFFFHVSFQLASLVAVAFLRRTDDVASAALLPCGSFWYTAAASLLEAVPTGAALWRKLAASRDALLHLRHYRALQRHVHASILHARVTGSLPPPPVTLNQNHHGSEQQRRTTAFTLLCFPALLFAAFVAFTALALLSFSRLLPCH